MRHNRGEEALFFFVAAVLFFLAVGFVVEDVFEEEVDEDCAKALGSNGENSPLLRAKIKTRTKNQR
jgi:hypothetical protein